MITTGSKFLIGSSVVAAIIAIVYGIAQGGVMGTVGLAFAAIALAALAAANSFARDSNVFLDSDAPPSTTSAARHTPASTWWPLGFGFSFVVIAVGLVTQQSIVIIGLALFAAMGAEWAIANWSSGASSDPAYNARVRGRLTNPLEFPIGAAGAIGVLVYAFSRVMLWLSKSNTVIAFAVVGAVVLVIAFVFANRPSVKSGAIGTTMALGAIVIVAAGTAAGLDGQRTIVHYETTEAWQNEAILHPEEYAEGAEHGEHPAEPICESPEEFPEADENASETVGLKANQYAVILTADGTLDFDIVGPSTGDRSLVIARGNVSNVLFRNDSRETRRLSVDLGPTEVTTADGETVEVRHQMCTTLIEPGGVQLLTLRVGVPSSAYADSPNPFAPDGQGGYWFAIPGAENSNLELVVQ